MFFGDSAGSKREEKVPQHVTDCINKNLPRADARASEPRAWRSEQGQVILHAALLYGAEGKASTYTSPRPLTFVCKEIEVDPVDGDSFMLSDSRLHINRRCGRQLRAACAGLVLIAASVSLFACSGAEETAYPESASHHEPAKLEPIKERTSCA